MRSSGHDTREAFAKTYGTKGSKHKNAFGKCVSRRAKERLKAEDHPKPERSHRNDKGKDKP